LLELIEFFDQALSSFVILESSLGEKGLKVVEGVGHVAELGVHDAAQGILGSFLDDGYEFFDKERLLNDSDLFLVTGPVVVDPGFDLSLHGYSHRKCSRVANQILLAEKLIGLKGVDEPVNGLIQIETRILLNNLWLLWFSLLLLNNYLLFILLNA